MRLEQRKPSVFIRDIGTGRTSSVSDISVRFVLVYFVVSLHISLTLVSESAAVLKRRKKPEKHSFQLTQRQQWGVQTVTDVLFWD